MQSIFITGIGTEIGKTVVAAIITEALEADYWKPVQAGYDNGTDADLVRKLIRNRKTIVHKESYCLKMAVSPHIAARTENRRISIDKIKQDHDNIITSNNQRQQFLVIEGAGGLMVPLNPEEFVTDLVRKLDCITILVSRNYLGSINHSLMTGYIAKQQKIRIGGWVFNDQYLDYEDEICKWSGISKIFSIPFSTGTGMTFISSQAEKAKPYLMQLPGITATPTR